MHWVFYFLFERGYIMDKNFQKAKEMLNKMTNAVHKQYFGNENHKKYGGGIENKLGHKVKIVDKK